MANMDAVRVTPPNQSQRLGRASNSDRSLKPMIFAGVLWFSLLIAFIFLVTLLGSIIFDGLGRLDSRLFTEYASTRPRRSGARAAILGSLWVVGFTAVMAIPLGIAAALHLEEFADKSKWWNRVIELNIQNLAAVPAILYGMLSLGILTFFGVKQKNIVFGGSLALALLILPVIILTTREALRAVPQEIRAGSLALGASPWQTAWRQTLPASLPGIATGTILAISRALGEAAPLLLLGALVYVRYDPNGLLSGFTTMPIQIFGWTSAPQDEFRTLAAAASVVLLGILLSLNGLAIFIRNKFSQRW